MSHYAGLEKPRQPDWQGLIDNIQRKGTPNRAYHIELFHDVEIRDAIAERFNLLSDVKADDTNRDLKNVVAVNRFCGFDYVHAGLVGLEWIYKWETAEDTGPLERAEGRNFMDEHTGPIGSWADFENYPWPDPTAAEATRDLEWLQDPHNLPEDMCIIGGLTGHFCELLVGLFGYEQLCYILHDQRDLVRAVADKVLEFHISQVERMIEFDRVKIIWGSDDMGFKTSVMISPADLREFVLPGHKKLAELAHAAGRLYILHSCGNLNEIIDDLIDDVKIDAKHSFEDTIEDVREVKETYGRRIALLGGIDMDFLCRADEQAIRRRVRQTLEVCNPGGGYCLGTGNSVANYIPLDNYLAMVDEGMLYGG